MTTEVSVPYRGTLIEGVRLPGLRTAAANAAFPILDKVSHLLPDRSQAGAFAVAVVAEMNQIEVACDDASVRNAVCNCASLGLIPGKARGHAYFVPKWSKKLGANECQLWPGYRGYVHLAYQTGFLKDVDSEVVFDGEPIRFWRDDEGLHVEHDITSRLMLGEDGRKILGAYCQWHTNTGGRGVFTVPGQVLESLRQKQGTNGQGKKVHTVWDSDPVGMARKTPLRRASKFWQLVGEYGGRLANAVMLDEQSERDETQAVIYQDAPAIDPPRRRRLSDLPDGSLTGLAGTPPEAMLAQHGTAAEAEPAEPDDEEPQRSLTFAGIANKIDKASRKDRDALDAIRVEIIAEASADGLTPEEHADLVQMLADKAAVR